MTGFDRGSFRTAGRSADHSARCVRVLKGTLTCSAAFNRNY